MSSSSPGLSAPALVRWAFAIAACGAVAEGVGAVASTQRQSTPPQSGRSSPPQGGRPTAPPAPRQGGPLVFRGGVEQVEVDVVVVDKAGKIVRGLTQKDFTVLDRKQPQTISTFEEVSRASATPTTGTPPPAVRHDVANNRAAQADRLIVLVVDDLHIYSGRTDKAKLLTKQLIDTMGRDASMAVLFTSGEHSTQVTEDRAQLLAAADTLKGRQSVRRPHSSSETNFAKGFSPEMSAEEKNSILKTVGSGQDFFDNITQYKTLEDAARLVGSDDVRRKAFVLVTEGISKNLTGLFTSDTSQCEVANPQVPCYHDIALRNAMNSMRRSNVATYSFDPRGHVSPQDLMRESQPAPASLLSTIDGKPTDDPSPVRITNPVRLAQDGLGILSAASGGFAVTDTDDFAGGMSRILEDLDHYYLLGFRPSDPNGKGFRPLDVRVAGHPDWTLRFRRGYLPGGPPAPPAGADPLLSGVMPKSDLPLRMFALAFPGTSATSHTARIAIAIEVAASTSLMIDGDGQLHDDITYQVLAIDEKKIQAVSRTNREAKMALKPVAKGPMPALASYQIDTSVDLAPGTYQLRASVSSVRLGKGGSVYLTLEVPDFSAAPIGLSGLALGYADGTRIPVAPVDAAIGRVWPFSPSLDRSFVATDAVKVYCEIARHTSGTTAQITAAIVDATGKVVSSSDHPLPANAPNEIVFTQPLGGLAPGEYRLRVTATSGATTVTREVGFRIV